MPTLSLDGLNLYYELHGKGKPLVLIAGYTCDHSVWGLMLEQLAQHFQVLLFDNRAVGQTQDDNRSFNLELMAEDTIKLIKELNLEKPHIVGHSMGGAIAQLIAKEYAQQIDKLIILNSTSKFNQRSNSLCQALLTARAKNVDLETLIDLSTACFYGPEFLANEEFCAGLKANLLTYPFLQTEPDQQRQFNALKTFDSTRWLETLNVPTLVLSSNEDIITVPQESHYLVEQIKHAELASIKGGHCSPIEAYNEVNRNLLRFLLS